VSKAIDFLSKSEEGKAKELKNALIALKLNDIEVDVSSTQIMLHEELSILRGAAESGVTGSLTAIKSVVGYQTSTEDLERIRSLENENSKLRELLKEAQFELTTKPVVVAPPLPPSEPIKGKDATGSSEELKAVRLNLDEKSRECDRLAKECDGFKRESERLIKEVQQATQQQKELTAQLQQSASQTSEKDKQLAMQKSQLDKLAVDLGDDSRERALRGEMEAVQRDLQTARSQLEAAGQDAAKLQAQLVLINKDAAAKLAVQAAELTAQGDRRVAEAESRLEAEKDEMMEAMAQEVDVGRFSLRYA
jgi:DNA repair exonuclease SbcCD ATPase subunit